MNRPGMVRDRVQTRVVDMLQHLCIQVSMYNPDELDVLRVIERPQQFDLAEKITRFIMEKLGHTTAPKEPRFDKTHRAMAKRRGRPPRGLKLAGEPKKEDALLP
jgi:hypothetical protein